MTAHARVAILLALVVSAACHAGEPALPEGIGGEPERKSTDPALPAGLDIPDEAKSTTTAPTRRELPFTGFIETRVGARTQEDDFEKELSLAETRLRLEGEVSRGGLVFRLSADIIADEVLSKYDTDLERGEGVVDLREANILLRPSEFLDIKIGRQVLTWGTGDMLFINDLFPKDWRSFFVGREIEYLKSPSDAIKTSVFLPWLNLDVVYTPRFDADRGITGERISHYDPATGRIAGKNRIADLARPDNWFEDDEVSCRLYKTFKSLEFAVYGYHGYWKSPAGFDRARDEAFYPKLDVFGGSLRGQLGKGVANFEFGYYASKDDESGRDPMVRNSEWRFLFGYEREIAKDFTGGVQYYLELMRNYGNYQAFAPGATPEKDEYRQVITLRLTKLLMSQNLTLSLFTYYSPSDKDAYLRPTAKYKLTDNWMVEIGGNIFIGEDDHTFFGQFEKNTNAYLAVRCSF